MDMEATAEALQSNQGYIMLHLHSVSSLLKYTVSLAALVFYLLSGTPSQSGVLLQAKGCQLEGLTYAGVSPAGTQGAGGGQDYQDYNPHLHSTTASLQLVASEAD